MKIKNNTFDTKLFFLVSILAVSVVGFNIFQIVDAIHSDEGINLDLVAGTNQIYIRDSSNTAPQTHSLHLDTSTVRAGFATITVSEDDSNLDFKSADIVLASATSTTSGDVETEVSLTESEPDFGRIFRLGKEIRGDF